MDGMRFRSLCANVDRLSVEQLRELRRKLRRMREPLRLSRSSASTMPPRRGAPIPSSALKMPTRQRQTVILSIPSRAASPRHELGTGASMSARGIVRGKLITLPARQIGISPPLISHGFFGSIQADPHHLKYLEFSSDNAGVSAGPVQGLANDWKTTTICRMAGSAVGRRRP